MICHVAHARFVVRVVRCGKDLALLFTDDLASWFGETWRTYRDG